MAKNSVQRIHDVTSGMDGIATLIDQVNRLSISDDLLVVQAHARLKQFQSKKDALETDIASMEQKRAELEANSADGDAGRYRSKPQAIDLSQRAKAKLRRSSYRDFGAR